MALFSNAALCALIAVLFWTWLGYAIARRLLPQVLAFAAAAVVGWAVHSALALPVYIGVGMSPATVIATGVLCIVAGGLSLSLRRPESEAEDDLPPWVLVSAAAVAGVLALVPAAALLPKFYGDAVQLADPIFDHSKSAIIDAISRLGVPPINPVFGEIGGAEYLAYYYLWHFSAAELALTAGATGWEADIGLTWFTAFASLCLMMGIAVWLGKRWTAALWVALLAAAGSLWVTLDWTFRSENLMPVLWPPVGMSGWLVQAAWAPQHAMAAACVVTAMLLLARCAQQQSVALVLTLALVIVAGFESSTFVGGIAFAVAGVVAAPVLLAATEPPRRLRLATGLALAALLVIGLSAPFIRDQLEAVRMRGGGSPIVVSPYTAWGEFLPPALRSLLDIPGYWLIILPIELPAVFIAGVIGMVAVWHRASGRAEKLAASILAGLAGSSLVISWLFASALGGNNDLGLRAFIPAAMVLIVGAASAAGGLPRTRLRTVVVTAALVGFALSLPDTAKIVRNNVAGVERPDGRDFAQSGELWAAVRRYAAPAARIANDPLFVQSVTPWPVNISWALLANRSSCFAGVDLAVALAPLSPERRVTINAQFIRVFAGEGTPDDVHEMAAKYGCDIVVLVPADKAWDRDPFAASPDYHLAEARAGRWRIYARAK